MIEHSNLLIVAGTGRNSGKTTLACSIIERFKEIEPVALKISPHFHEPSQGLELLRKASDYNIFRENSVSGDKDSSRMLISGASSAYYIQVFDKNAGKAFSWLVNHLNSDKAIVCESPALRRFINPGVFIIADSEAIVDKKDLSDIYDTSDLVFIYGNDPDKLVLAFEDRTWRFGFNV